MAGNQGHHVPITSELRARVEAATSGLRLWTKTKPFRRRSFAFTELLRLALEVLTEKLERGEHVLPLSRGFHGAVQLQEGKVVSRAPMASEEAYLALSLCKGDARPTPEQRALFIKDAALFKVDDLVSARGTTFGTHPGLIGKTGTILSETRRDRTCQVDFHHLGEPVRVVAWDLEMWP